MKKEEVEIILEKYADPFSWEFLQEIKKYYTVIPICADFYYIKELKQTITINYSIN